MTKELWDKYKKTLIEADNALKGLPKYTSSEESAQEIGIYRVLIGVEQDSLNGMAKGFRVGDLTANDFKKVVIEASDKIADIANQAKFSMIVGARS